MAWSLAGRASHPVLLPTGFYAATGSLYGAVQAATTRTDAFAPGGTAVAAFPNATHQPLGTPSGAPWQHMFTWNASPAAALTAYTGRFRLYAYLKFMASYGTPWQVSGDVSDLSPFDAVQYQPLASAAPIATLIPQDFSTAASPAYQLVDLGVHTMPANQAASGATWGLGQGLQIRVWAKAASPNLGVASLAVSFGGIAMLPVEGAHGVIADMRGGELAVFDGLKRSVDSANAGVSTYSFADIYAWRKTLLPFYSGQMPYVTASTSALHLLSAHRSAVAAVATGRTLHDAPYTAYGELSYRPTFQFLKGL
jgi:hypothetical protein